MKKQQKMMMLAGFACLMCISMSSAVGVLASTSSESDDDTTPTSNTTPAARTTASTPGGDCVGAWGEWGDCSQECSYNESQGTQSRTYKITTEAGVDGTACPQTDGKEETQECGMTACTPLDCVGDWDAWKVEGTNQTREWTITQEPKYGGAECAVAESVRTETKACTDATACPPVNCVGSWVNVGSCSKTCGPDGKQQKRYDVSTPASGVGGTACSYADGTTKEESCNTDKVCPVDCVGSFGNWSSCSESCGPGTKRRTYSVTTPVAGTGTTCAYDDGHQETADCEDKPCDVNCDGHWTIAESDVKTTGVSKIKWKQTQAKTGNGTDCKATFIKNGKRNEWEDQIVNDGDWAEHIYGNDGLLEKRDVRNHIQNEFGTPNKTGDQYIYCVRRPNTTGTASRWPQGHPAYKSWEYNLCDNDS